MHCKLFFPKQPPPPRAAAAAPLPNSHRSPRIGRINGPHIIPPGTYIHRSYLLRTPSPEVRNPVHSKPAYNSGQVGIIRNCYTDKKDHNSPEMDKRKKKKKKKKQNPEMSQDARAKKRKKITPKKAKKKKKRKEKRKSKPNQKAKPVPKSSNLHHSKTPRSRISLPKTAPHIKMFYFLPEMIMKRIIKT
jgi:hypothetical protein